MRSIKTLSSILSLGVFVAIGGSSALAMDMTAICRLQHNDPNAAAVAVGNTFADWKCQTGVNVQLGCPGGQARNDNGRLDGWYCAGGSPIGSVPANPGGNPPARKISVNCGCYGPDHLLRKLVDFNVDAGATKADIVRRGASACRRELGLSQQEWTRWFVDNCTW